MDAGFGFGEVDGFLDFFVEIEVFFLACAGASVVEHGVGDIEDAVDIFFDSSGELGDDFGAVEVLGDNFPAGEDHADGIADFVGDASG